MALARLWIDSRSDAPTWSRGTPGRGLEVLLDVEEHGRGALDQAGLQVLGLARDRVERHQGQRERREQDGPREDRDQPALGILRAGCACVLRHWLESLPPRPRAGL